MLTFKKNRLGQVKLVAAEQFPEGTVVFDLNMGEFYDKPNLRTIEIGAGLHVDHPYGRYTNHSCDPTCFVDQKEKVMRAARDIEVGEEINFDYMMNETDLSTSFECACGSVNCRGFIGHENSKPSHL